MTLETDRPIMPLDHIDDWEQRLARQDAFWDGAIIDRPVVSMACGASDPDYPAPAEKDWPKLRDRWLDAEFQAERALHGVMNTNFLGDSAPAKFPNLGPEVFSAYFDMEMEYGEHTSWSIPCLDDWSEVDQIQFSEDNFYWRKTMEMTDALLACGKGKFYTGFTDLHPGGDCIAAFRDPLKLNMDMIEHYDDVKALRERVDDVFEHVFTKVGDKLEAADQAFSTWPGIVSTRRWHVPSNDFSCMISKPMFDDVFLPGIAHECRLAEASIYHLDGPQALRHLDSLLSIPELNAIQWVYGAGNGKATDWLDVYLKCQAAGKGIQLYIGQDELPAIIENLRPEGVWMGVGVRSPEEADEVLKQVSKWT